ncbi:MAG: haloacid dehalogenase-like hydrolase [Candidatus Ancillula sp.]|jgi:phosphoserine phosphatase|nr:haloacid dehalogenase-like hydrolase [Candidatus Ancillula sp.]
MKTAEFNVYDFDKTIYAGDSTVDFYIFCLKNNPKLVLSIFPNFVNACKFKLRLIKRSEFKENFYISFLPKVDVETMVQKFWQVMNKKVQKWYLDQKRANDLIISASATFLLAKICKQLEVELLASDVDVKTGRLLGPNLRGVEKVKLYKARYEDTPIDNFYTDSLSDKPMMDLAENAHLVK